MATQDVTCSRTGRCDATVFLHTRLLTNQRLDKDLHVISQAPHKIQYLFLSGRCNPTLSLHMPSAFPRRSDVVGLEEYLPCPGSCCVQKRGRQVGFRTRPSSKNKPCGADSSHNCTRHGDTFQRLRTRLFITFITVSPSACSPLGSSLCRLQSYQALLSLCEISGALRPMISTDLSRPFPEPCVSCAD